MKEHKAYIAFAVVGVGLLVTAAIVGLNTTDATRGGGTDGEDIAAGCPTSRMHIEASLHTKKADGMYYRLTRKSVRTPIRNVLIRMRGADRAREAAQNTRAFAKQKLAEGAKGPERRFYLDSILRADALLAILDCLDKQRAL